MAFQLVSRLLLGLEFEINSAGEFFYDGTPESDSLVVSIATQPGTDRYVNPVLAGVVSYLKAGNQAVQLDQTTLNWVYDLAADRLAAFLEMAPASGTPPAVWLGISSGSQLWIGAGSDNSEAVAFIPPSGDATGATDSASINAAIARGQTIWLLPGKWHLASTVTASTGDWIIAPGAFISWLGTGDCFRFVDSSPYASRDPLGGAGILGFPVIDGTGGGAGSTGVHAGDILQLKLEVMVQNFTGYGVLFDNQNFWTEQLYARTYTQDCADHIGYTFGGAGTSSFARADAIHYINQGPTAANNGVVLGAGAQLYDLIQLGIYGNFTAAATGTAGAVLTLGAGAKIAGAGINFGVECGGSGPVVPQTISFGAGAAVQGSGYADFAAGAVAFAPSNNGGGWQYDGLVLGDATLPRRTYAGAWSQSIGTGGTLFASLASVITCSPSAAVTGVILAAGGHEGQQVTVINRSAFAIAFAAAGTSHVSGGTGVSIAAGAAMTFWWDSTGALWYPA